MKLKHALAMEIAANLRDGKDVDLGSFGEMMDRAISRSAVELTVGKTEDAKEWYIVGDELGPVMDFYILMNAMEPIYISMLDEMEIPDGVDLADRLCEILRGSLHMALDERKGADTDAESGADGGTETADSLGG